MFLLKVEPWEQPTKKSTLIFEKLNSKYVKVNLIDKNDCSDDDDEGGEPVLAERFRCRTITWKIDSVTWKKGKGNSYVVNAFDVCTDGKLDRKKLTECKIDNTLIGLIKDATVKGRNTGFTFVDAGGDMDAIEPAAASDVRAAEADDEEPADKSEKKWYS